MDKQDQKILDGLEVPPILKSKKKWRASLMVFLATCWIVVIIFQISKS